MKAERPAQIVLFSLLKTAEIDLQYMIYHGESVKADGGVTICWREIPEFGEKYNIYCCTVTSVYLRTVCSHREIDFHFAFMFFVKEGHVWLESNCSVHVVIAAKSDTLD